LLCFVSKFHFDPHVFQAGKYFAIKELFELLSLIWIIIYDPDKITLDLANRLNDIAQIVVSFFSLRYLGNRYRVRRHIELREVPQRMLAVLIS